MVLPNFLEFFFFMVIFFGFDKNIFAQNTPENIPAKSDQQKTGNKTPQTPMRARIMDSDVEARFPCSAPNIDTMHNADNSVMYVAECNEAEKLYSLVILKTQNAASGTAAEREYRLIFYANQFKTMIDVENCPVFIRDVKMPNNTEVVGIQYRCDDKSGMKYAIQGWLYDKQIVLYTVSSKDLPENKAFEFLYNSVLFW